MAYTNNDIYLASLALIDENSAKGDCSDLAERAPYLIASFCSLCRSLDKKLRERDSLETQPRFSSVKLSLESLYDKYCDAIAMLGAECNCEAIKDCYFFD